MAIKNPRKKFNFRITVMESPIIEPFAAQQVTLPDSEIEVTEHGFGNTTLKTAGKVKVGTLKIDRIIGSDITSIGSGVFYDWQKLAQDPNLQGGADPDVYKKTIRIEEIGNSGWNGVGTPTVLNTWYCYGCWPSNINGREFDRTSSDNLVESIEFSVDYFDNGAI